MFATVVDPAEADALTGGYHGDAFRILGPHVVAPDAKGGAQWEVRAYLPQAAGVEVLLDGAAAAMKPVHPLGLYSATLPGDPHAYRLRVLRKDGAAEEIDDPYRFPPLLSDFDLHLHGEGTQHRSYLTMGAHLVECEGVAGVRFAVWAPNAEVVTVVGDFNQWDARRHPMRARNGGVWELFIPGIAAAAAYKYNVRSRVR
ncbi:MAG: 1,4-alpha-glucan branching enzyme, partial [Bryobacteraceae bacterium]